MFFFFNDTATTEIYTLSLHDALPISSLDGHIARDQIIEGSGVTTLELCHVVFETGEERSEEHTSELQSQSNLVCRLLLEKKKSPRADLVGRGTCHLRQRIMQLSPGPG